LFHTHEPLIIARLFLKVVGPKKTGKTSLINLLLDTSTISPGNSQDQLKALQTYRQSSGRPTTAIKTATFEILQGAPNRTPSMDDRIAVTCIDTPGLDYSESKELALELSVSEIVRYLDLQFAETMVEESKVVRTSKGDQHVHLCVNPAVLSAQ
jgi:septin family protein